MHRHRRLWALAIVLFSGLSVLATSHLSAQQGATFKSGTRTVPLYAGAMHYWRIAPRHWEACLRGLRDLGLALVESYVPWSVHEQAAGRFDWSGPRDLGRIVGITDIACGSGARLGPDCGAQFRRTGEKRVGAQNVIAIRGAALGDVLFQQRHAGNLEQQLRH